MNKDWDKAVVSVDIWKECLRVLKPGAFAAVMSSPRQDVLARMIVNLQYAGFRTDFTSIYWTYASGFPKAMNIGKRVNDLKGGYAGFQPKPAVEVILMVMKPLSEKSYVDQALANGKGITWLDDCRIPFQNDKDVFESHEATGLGSDKCFYDGNCQVISKSAHEKGRFPANLLVSDDVLNDGTVSKSVGGFSKWNNNKGLHTWNELKVKQGDRKETVLPRSDKVQQFNVPVDAGSYSRFFDLDKWFDTTFPFLAIPKASSSEKNKGLDKWLEGKKVNDGRTTPIDNPFQRGETLRKNVHPTVKPLKLMSWLVTLLTRPRDIVLDPFSGSGTTCLAAKMLKRDWIGIELNKEYVDIASKRLGIAPTFL